MKTCLSLSELSINNSLAALIAQGSCLLATHSDSAKLDAQLLLAYSLNKPITYLLTWPEKRLSQEHFDLYVSLIAERITGKPIAYLIKSKEFWSLELLVSSATLIPRPDTETLVERVLDVISERTDLSLKPCLLDLGTGTGAIALALASELPLWQIDALDYQDEAVKLAQLNAKRLALHNVSIFQSDWFSKVARKRYDIIVSNPPYIDENDQHLLQGDVRFEPHSALIAKEQGFADIIKIIDTACDFLNDNGLVFIEHGYQQGKKVRDIFTSKGYFQPVTEQDLNGNDRITWATYHNNEIKNDN